MDTSQRTRQAFGRLRSYLRAKRRKGALQELRTGQAPEYQRTKLVLRFAERLVIRERQKPTDDTRLDLLAETLFISPMLVGAGVRILARRWALTATIALVCFVYLLVVVKHDSWGSFLGALCFGAGVVYFGLPSQTVTAGLRPHDIDVLAGEIARRVTSDGDLDRLTSGLALLRTQKTERLARFGVLASVGWAALFWYATSHVFALGLPTEAIRIGMPNASAAAVGFIIVLGIASAHSTAVRAVHLTAEFALLEVRRRHER